MYQYVLMPQNLLQMVTFIKVLYFLREENILFLIVTLIWLKLTNTKGNIEDENIKINYNSYSKPFSCHIIQGNSTSNDVVITIGSNVITLQKINHLKL